MSVKELFDAATDHLPKAERKAAFQKLRQLSQYGSPEEIAEAKLALQHSALYREYGGNVESILRALE